MAVTSVLVITCVPIHTQGYHVSGSPGLFSRHDGSNTRGAFPSVPYVLGSIVFSFLCSRKVGNS